MKTLHNKYNEMRKLYYYTCGEVLEIANWTEMLLANILYMVKFDEMKIYNPTYFDSLSFENKKQLFFELINNGSLSVHKPYKRIKGDIEDIQRVRNIYAHSILHTDKSIISEFNGEWLHFIKLDAGGNFSQYSISTKKKKEDPKRKLYCFDNHVFRGNMFRKWATSLLLNDVRTLLSNEDRNFLSQKDNN